VKAEVEAEAEVKGKVKAESDGGRETGDRGKKSED